MESNAFAFPEQPKVMHYQYWWFRKNFYKYVLCTISMVLLEDWLVFGVRLVNYFWSIFELLKWISKCLLGQSPAFLTFWWYYYKNIRRKWPITTWIAHFVLMISLDLMKSSEVKKEGDRSIRLTYQKNSMETFLAKVLHFLFLNNI